jgi:hypothetical protein
MALTDKKYSAIHNKTGSDKDKIKNVFDEGHTAHFADNPEDNPIISALIYQIQEMQEELDYLRTEISANKDKTGITSSQANAITANTAKTGITSQQATDIANNKANIGNKLEVMPNVNGTNQQRLLCGVMENRGVYTLNFAYEDTVKGQRVRKTGSIQLR